MASPWKFLSRLVSRRQSSKEQQDGVIDDVKSEEAVLERVEAATDTARDSFDRLGEGEPEPADQSDAAMTVPEHPAQAGSAVQSEVDRERASLVDAAGTALSDEVDFSAAPTDEAPTISPSKRRPSAKQKRSEKAGLVKSVEILPQPPVSPPTFSDEVQSLDEEIKLLRDQLARKLQVQNAQLRMLLKRFER